MNSVPRFVSRSGSGGLMKRRSRWLVMAVPAVLVIVGVAPSAVALGTADLAITQSTSPQPNGAVLLKGTLTNAGPSAATATVIETVSGSNITGMTVTNSTVGVRCKAFTPPAGTAFARRCTTLSALPSGAIWRVSFKVIGPTGTAVKGTGRAASSDTNDPQPTNNTADFNSWTGPVADLELSAAIVQPATSVVDVVNKGPNDTPDLRVITSSRAVWILGPGCEIWREPPLSTCDIGPLAAGASWRGTVDYALSPTTPFTVVATHPGSFDPTPGNNLAFVDPLAP
jgi:hypothetical protein